MAKTETFGVEYLDETLRDLVKASSELTGDPTIDTLSAFWKTTHQAVFRLGIGIPKLEFEVRKKFVDKFEIATEEIQINASEISGEKGRKIIFEKLRDLRDLISESKDSISLPSH